VKRDRRDTVDTVYDAILDAIESNGGEVDESIDDRALRLAEDAVDLGFDDRDDKE
jgi:hypothetical protein